MKYNNKNSLKNYNQNNSLNLKYLNNNLIKQEIK